MKTRLVLALTFMLVCGVTGDAMTKAQMQSLALAITNAGYQADLIPVDATTWRVRAQSTNVDVPIAAANNIAVSQGVPAFVAAAEFGPMTLAKMQTVSNAITNAGYDASAIQRSPGQWIVRATSSDVNIPTSDVAALATAQSVPALISLVEFR